MAGSPLLVVADASALISLEASQSFADIVTACGMEVGVVDPQVWGEALFVHRPGAPRAMELIDLDSYERGGLVRRLALEGAEIAAFVQLAALMDDGEAASLGIAVARGLPMVGDDRAIARVIRQEALGVQLYSTPSLVRTWARAATPSPVRVAEILANVETYGHYVPPSNDPDYEWWVAARGKI